RDHARRGQAPPPSRDRSAAQPAGGRIMTHPGVAMLKDSGLDPAVAELLEQLADRVQAGETIDADELARDHPDHAEQLVRLLPAVQALAALDASKQTGTFP